jgi:hypothetical protein
MNFRETRAKKKCSFWAQNEIKPFIKMTFFKKNKLFEQHVHEKQAPNRHKDADEK